MRQQFQTAAAPSNHPSGRWAVKLLMVGAAFIPIAPAIGQSLDTANTSALTNSFTLRASLADSDGAEARMRGSRDQFLPTISYSVDRPISSHIDYSPFPQPTSLGLGDIPVSDPTYYSWTVSLPLFDRLKRWNDLQSSSLLASASQQRVSSVQQQVLLETSVAYLSVVRDTKIVSARQAQLAAVQKILESVRTQFAVNDATRTDVALAQSRVQDAETAVERASTNLTSSRIEFSRLSRLDPERLTPPVIRDLLPKTEEEYVDLVRSANPKLRAAQLDARSATYQARSSLAGLSPQVSFAFSHVTTTGYSPTLDRIRDNTARIVAKIPIYTPGTLPRISEANALARQREYEVEDAELQLMASARSGYQKQRSSIAQIASANARVAALRSTVKGMEVERIAGFRTVLDSLNLRGELGDAEVALAALVTERNALLLELAANANLLSGTMLQPHTASKPADRESRRLVKLASSQGQRAVMNEAASGSSHPRAKTIQRSALKTMGRPHASQLADSALSRPPRPAISMQEFSLRSTL